MKRSIVVEADEVAGVYAALSSMVRDVHCAEDDLSVEEWEKAKQTWFKFENEMNRRTLEQKKLENSKIASVKS